MERSPSSISRFLQAPPGARPLPEGRFRQVSVPRVRNPSSISGSQGDTMNRATRRFPRTMQARLLVSACLLCLATSTSAGAVDPCSRFVELQPNETLRGSADGARVRDCFRIELSEPGLLTLDVSSSAGADVEPWLELPASRETGRPDVARYRVLEKRPAGVVAEIEAPGSVFLFVRPEDPERSLPDYKLRSAFVGTATTVVEGIVFCLLDPGGRSRSGKSVDEEECEVIELGSLELGHELLLTASCGLGEVDDHGNTFPCATPLASFPSLEAHDAGPAEIAVVGTLGSPNDDQDFFTFELAEEKVVEIVVRGSVPGHLTLYDGRGLRLGSWGTGRSFSRLVRNLPAGRYTLRLRGDLDGEDEYVLSLKDLGSW